MGAGFSLHKGRVLVGYRRNTAYCVVFGVSIEKYCIHMRLDELSLIEPSLSL